MNILVFNAGSSSFKLRLYQLTEQGLPIDPISAIWQGEVTWNSAGIVLFTSQSRDGHSRHFEGKEASRQKCLHYLLNWLWQGETQVICGIEDIHIVGHRVVQGGDKYRQPMIINAEVKAEINRLSVFAPLHNPANIIGIEAIELLSTSLPQIAVFDTAFYGNLLPVSYVYPLPYAWLEKGIRKYGFHGISHEYCTQRAAQVLGRELTDLRLISCHLGNGCSLAAMADGNCINTTMGFTPLDGLMMGTRGGSIDPGILLHLLREADYTVQELDHILNFESGLLGVSGVSNDVREIDQAIAQGNTRAKLALAMYIDRLTAKIASLLPALGGLDALIFTAGVGENHAGIRAAVANQLAFLGVVIDPVLNQAQVSVDRDLAAPQSPVRLLVIHTQEEWQIAKACWQLVTATALH